MTQCYFVMPTNGAVSEFEKFDNVFSFYPDGVKGLIGDYIAMYLKPTGPSSFDPNAWCTAGEGTLEEEMLLSVLDRYEKSTEYRATHYSYPDCQTEVTIETICESIAKKIYDTLQEHNVYFLSLRSPRVVQDDDVIFTGDTVILKMDVAPGILL